MHLRILLAATLAGANVLAQSPTTQPPTSEPPPNEPSAAATAAPTPTSQWEFSVAAYTYFVPDGSDYLQPTITADRDALHFEARYNYEDRDTGSVWFGWNLHFGDELTWDLTPMVGGVFGNTEGVAPGYHSTLAWQGLELYSEGEYVFDTADSSDSYFYTWSELTYAPADWLRVGLVIQRTRLYETDLDTQRGVLLGISTAAVDFTAHLFNPDESEPVVVFSIGLGF